MSSPSRAFQQGQLLMISRALSEIIARLPDDEAVLSELEQAANAMTLTLGDVELPPELASTVEVGRGAEAAFQAIKEFTRFRKS